MIIEHLPSLFIRKHPERGSGTFHDQPLGSRIACDVQSPSSAVPAVEPPPCIESHLCLCSLFSSDSSSPASSNSDLRERARIERFRPVGSLKAITEPYR